jgi:hypothetical protein
MAARMPVIYPRFWGDSSPNLAHRCEGGAIGSWSAPFVTRDRHPDQSEVVRELNCKSQLSITHNKNRREVLAFRVKYRIAVWDLAFKRSGESE